MSRLDLFVGAWDVEAVFARPEPMTVTGRTSFEWILDGHYLLQRSEGAHPVPDSSSVFGATADGRYVQHYFDSRGVTRLYEMEFDDGVWRLQRDSADFSPLPFHQRFTGTFGEDGATIAGEWETSDDGSAWEHDFFINYTRVD